MDAHRGKGAPALTKSPRTPLLLAAALGAALAAQAGLFIVSHSNTFDEPAVIGAGYSYVKTGRLDLETRVHPPLMKYLFGAFVALAGPDLKTDSPALKRDLPYPFGHDFVFRNSVRPETILALARLPSLLLSLALAACLWAWSARWFGPWGGALSLAAYAFEPNILAHSGLANMDLGVTAFLFMACHFLVLHLEEPATRRLVAAGVLAGCAAAAKLPGIFFFVWSAALSWLSTRRLGAAVRLNLKLLALAAAVVVLCYQVRFLPRLGGLLAQMVPAIFVPNHPTESHFNFLLGELKVGGWPHYYLVALAVKCTLPFLLLSFLGAWKGLKPRERAALAVPALSYLLICSLASKQNGVRYVLPVLPFLCLALGAAVRLPPRALAAAVALLGWHALESAAIAPNYLAYFNQLAGGPRRGHEVLVDSNLDWGQDFRRLQVFRVAHGEPEAIVACLGNGDRDHYFGRRQDLLVPSEEPGLYRHENSSAPAREWLIVSASYLHGFGLSDPEAFSWLRGRAPLAQPGHASFVYDIGSDALSHFNVGKLYLRSGKHALARRQFARAAALEPAQPLPLLGLGDAQRALGEGRLAAAAYAEALRRAPPGDLALRRLIRERMKH